MAAWRAAAVLAMATVAIAAPGLAQDADRDAPLTVRSAFKASGLLSRLPDAPLLFPERTSGAALWRLRIEPVVRLGVVTVETAVEPRVRLVSSAGAEGTVFGDEARAAWRVTPLEWSLGSGDHGKAYLEIDRAAVHARLPGVELVVGRQAIGWGRGVLFGAVDLFSPLTPLEADREWRRGVDAVRADVRLADRIGLDVVGAFGESIDASAFAGRLRGYAGKADIEVVGGRRARDPFGGLTSSVAVGGIELHSELAIFRTPPESGTFGRTTIIKAVTGGSGRVPIGSGVLLFGEYHYSGFGAPSATETTPYLADAAFRERYLRGDMQMLGRHVLAALATYERSPETTWSLQWLQSPVDGSGVIVPSTTLTMSDRWSVVMAGYVPYGRRPSGTSLGSDFGAVPLGLFAQLRVYR